MSEETAENPKADIIARLELARISYLYGEGDKRPIRSTAVLAKKFDLDSVMVARHTTQWLAELRANARSSSALYGKAIDPETYESHEGDVAFLREQINLLQGKMEKLGQDSVGGESYEFYLKQMLKLQKRWSELCGVESAIRIADLAKLTFIREEVRMQLEAEKEKPAEQPETQVRKVDARIFDMEDETAMSGR